MRPRIGGVFMPRRVEDFLSINRPLIPLDRAFGERFKDSRLIVEVPIALTQQEQVLVRLRRSIRHRFWHRIGFRPDDIGSEKPAVRLKREGDAPWDADEILSFQTILRHMEKVIGVGGPHVRRYT